jgi:hypothetical protein
MILFCYLARKAMNVLAALKKNGQPMVTIQNCSHPVELSASPPAPV